ncbi:hypothetical protein HPP92_006826 [Vanilla planifolia]|uniref:Uncharacterized protein n=1 Tax=Vanilla planifolia TaxID=51239 RepID=A0A835RPM0_VANPL|nr:hypothetical protein HPP92_006826 [Vanilla planifolia]
MVTPHACKGYGRLSMAHPRQARSSRCIATAGRCYADAVRRADAMAVPLAQGFSARLRDGALHARLAVPPPPRLGANDKASAGPRGAPETCCTTPAEAQCL